jgi:small subunit ribosomal protein S18
MKTHNFSYKKAEDLRRFVTAQGAILPRAKTGLTAKLQKKLAREVKRARHLALLPFTQTV